MGLFIKRPGGAVFCFARCCGIGTLPPGYELNALVEAILLFGFVCVSSAREVHGCHPSYGGCLENPTGGIVHPVGRFARVGIMRGGNWDSPKRPASRSNLRLKCAELSVWQFLERFLILD